MEKYENLGLVGEGSYGIVMKCRHKATGTLVAIKKFLESEDDKIVKRIANREIKMLRQLRHENLVNLIDVFKRKKKLYLVFEFVDYTLLDDLEKHPSGLEDNYAKKILFQVLRGIEFCHNNDVIHRDIKPENILVSKSGIVKLCDFGFARPLSGQSNSFTDYVATRWYRAPELLVGDTKYGRPVDIWAIGCLTSEMFSGDPLFPGDSDIDQLYHVIKCIGSICPKHIEIFNKNVLFKGLRMPEITERLSLEKRYNHMSKEIIKFIEACLEATPEDRPSCSDLLNFELFNNNYFLTVFINEIKMKVAKEREKNPLLKNSIKSYSSMSKHENNNITIIQKPQIDKVQLFKCNYIPQKQQTSVNYRIMQSDPQKSNQENEVIITNKNTPIIEEDLWKVHRPLTSRKERVASRAGRISVIKDAFNKTDDGSNVVDCQSSQNYAHVAVDVQRPSSRLSSVIDNEIPMKIFNSLPPYIGKLDNQINKRNSPLNTETSFPDNVIKIGSMDLPIGLTHQKVMNNMLPTEKPLTKTSPVTNDVTIQSNHYSSAPKKNNLHSTNQANLNNPRTQVGSYPTLHQQYSNNQSHNYNVLKQLSTNYSQRLHGNSVENMVNSNFPNIGKDTKIRSNHLHFPNMSPSNKATVTTGSKSPSPMVNDRSGLYYNMFNKKKTFVNNRSNHITYQDNNIILPELKGAEITMSRNQASNLNTKYKYNTAKSNFVSNDSQVNTIAMESHDP